LLGYFLFAGVPSVPHGHWPLVVNIAGHLDTKLAAIACYQSQFPPEKAHVYPRVRAMAETVGLMAGCTAGELLAGSRMPCTAEPLRTLFPPQ
jgi:LmbE family N-acetylglucosaminyl deacetylase